MQTDELRAELAELAREVDAFPEDLGAVRRRVARRRVAERVGRAWCSWPVSSRAASRSPGRPVTSSTSPATPSRRTIARLPRVDALVVLPQNAHRATTSPRSTASSTPPRAVEGYATVPRNFAANVDSAGALTLAGRARARPFHR